jgi:hypothetical protein
LAEAASALSVADWANATALATERSFTDSCPTAALRYSQASFAFIGAADSAVLVGPLGNDSGGVCTVVDVVGLIVLGSCVALVQAPNNSGIASKARKRAGTRRDQGQTTRPRPVMSGRSSAVMSPGEASITAGTAFTRRMAVALSPPVLWSPSVPMSWRSTV